MPELLIIAVAIYGFALVSERSQMSPITAPMVFTTVGLIVGAGGLGWFDLELEGEAVSILVEGTLVLVLFTDAIRIDLRRLGEESAFPARLLGIGLPLSIAFGTAAALLIFTGLSVADAALLAAILAPTDAALGQAVVRDRRLPVRIRQGLNVESGLNDGIVVPIVTVMIALAAHADAGGADIWGELIVRQISFGLVSGIGIGALGAWLLDLRAVSGRIDTVYRKLATIAIAAAAFATASLLGGNGFIAAFTAGIAFGYAARDQCDDVQDFTEDEGELLNAITFIVFGAVLVGPALDELTWQIGLYAAASLTVVRVIPVIIALIGSGTLIETRWFAGWFGPRGLASILFALLVLEKLDSPNTDTIYHTAIWTVLASVYLHGLSASPWAGRLARRFEDASDDQAEMISVPEMPARRGLM